MGVLAITGEISSWFDIKQATNPLNTKIHRYDWSLTSVRPREMRQPCMKDGSVGGR